MTIPNLQVILLTLIFLVPGYIINSVYSLMTIRRTEIKELLLLRFLGFSVLNLVFTYPLVHLLVTGDFIDRHPYYSWLWLLTIIFIAPILIGILIGLSDKHDLIRNSLGKLGFNALTNSPTAWDEKFAEICCANDTGRSIEVTMKDGTKFAGFFGNKGSTASTDPKERDLYLEVGFKFIDGEWTRPDRTNGILLKGDDILAIEFFFDEEAEGAGHSGQQTLNGNKLLSLQEGEAKDEADDDETDGNKPEESEEESAAVKGRNNVEE